MNTENGFDIQIQLNFSDVVHANRLFRASKISYIAGLALGVLCLIIGGQYLLCYAPFFLVGLLTHQPLDFGNNNIEAVILLIVLSLIGLLLICDVLVPLLIWLRFRNNAQHSTEPRKVKFDNGGIVFEAKSARGQYDWSSFKECVEGSREFILIYGKGLYITIPKKAFLGENEIELFRGFLQSRLPIFKQRSKTLIIGWPI